MPRTYAVADRVVLPSYGSCETWGLAINEAMCLGIPVIASTHVGCTQDLIHPHENGLIFPAGDVPALTRSLQEAFSDRQRLQRWGENSRNIISQYSYNQATQGLNKALDYIICGGLHLDVVQTNLSPNPSPNSSGETSSPFPIREGG